ncbi:hypothetical protein LTR66_013893, partial [Elasticomyces elasticus]
ALPLSLAEHARVDDGWEQIETPWEWSWEGGDDARMMRQALGDDPVDTTGASGTAGGDVGSGSRDAFAAHPDLELDPLGLGYSAST